MEKIIFDIGLTYYPGTNTTIQTAVTTSCFFMFFLMIYIGYILCNNDLNTPIQFELFAAIK